MPVRIGDVEILALSDGGGRFPHSFAEFFPGSAEGAFAPWRGLHPGAYWDGDGPGAPDRPLGRWGAFLLRTPGAVVLVDTGFAGGMGPYPPGGELLGALASHGVMPADVDLVVFSHLHPDHVLGTFDEHGEPVFEHATYACGEADWAFFTAPERVDGFPWIGSQVAPLGSGAFDLRLLPSDRESELVPGVSALPAPGHSPGHTALLVHGGAAEGPAALLAGDAFFHPAQLQHTDWFTESDGDPDTATATRRDLLGRVLDRDVLVGACHFPAPALGRAVSAGPGRVRWEPVA